MFYINYTFLNFNIQNYERLQYHVRLDSLINHYITFTSTKDTMLMLEQQKQYIMLFFSLTLKKRGKQKYKNGYIFVTLNYSFSNNLNYLVLSRYKITKSTAITKIFVETSIFNCFLTQHLKASDYFIKFVTTWFLVSYFRIVCYLLLISKTMLQKIYILLN